MESVSGILAYQLTFVYAYLCVSISLCSFTCVYARTPVHMVRFVPVYSSHLYVCMYGTYVCMCVFFYVWYISYSSVTL